MYQVKTIAYSRAIGCRPIRTVLACYPRLVHAEMLRHRVFSPSVMSSRAVPIERMIQSVLESTARPADWRRNQPGMVGGESFTGEELASLNTVWDEARDDAIRHARRLAVIGAHKEDVNRILEPFVFVRTVFTGTEWDNFFSLRDDSAADPSIRKLAVMLRDDFRWNDQPRLLASDEWHLPFISESHAKTYGGWSDPTGTLRLQSAARVARTSYRTFGDNRESTLEQDKKVFDKLVGDHKLHASPFEQVARPAQPEERTRENERNFRDWIQMRVSVEREYYGSKG